jgi:uncharacterized iron-regulated protein
MKNVFRIFRITTAVLMTLTLAPLVAASETSSPPLPVDPAGNDGAEWLASYLSKDLYEEQEGKGWEYRKGILAEYESYATEGKEFALSGFKGGADLPSQAIGNGKAFMVIHMLKRLVGAEKFSEALRDMVDEGRFRKVSWSAIQDAFQKASGKKLGWFFDQWVNRKGTMSFGISGVSISPKGMQYALSFDVVQKEPVFIVDLPVSVRTDGGRVEQTLEIKDKKQTFEILVDGTPRELVIDGNYDTFRRLSPEEAPALIADMFAAEGRVVVLPEGAGPRALFKGAEEFLRKRNYTVKEPGEVENEEIKKNSLVVFGSGNPLLRGLFALTERPVKGMSFTVRRNPLNPAKIIAVLDADSDHEVREALDKLTQYGGYSSVAFREGRNVQKKIAESKRGWSVALKETITGVEVAKARTLEDIVRGVSGKRIVYVGEEHDRYEHHVAQLDVIRELYKEDRRLAIGMEMFQRPSQKALDDYIEGRIDEREFLKSSGYFKQWGLDYNYYRNILRFARDEKIPVVALNIRREVVDKVARAGLDSLSGDEKKELPGGMDLSDEEYAKRLREIFEKHEGFQGRDFSNFYQAQVIWDEVMSESIDRFLKKHPDYRFVVIAGGGHFAFGSGIPKRTFRRNGLDYTIMLNDTSVEPGVADFVLFPRSVPLTHSPKLMVMLKEEDGRAKVSGFPAQSVSEKAGLKEGDVVLSLDDTKVGSVEDMQIFLFYKKQGDTVRVRVLRKRFFLGDREMTFEVTL